MNSGVNGMNILEIKVDSAVVDVHITDDEIQMSLADGRQVSAPLEWFPRLRDATHEQRANWRLIANGVGVHWPEVDEDISARSLLAA
jgi:hypothetical protein